MKNVRRDPEKTGTTWSRSTTYGKRPTANG